MTEHNGDSLRGLPGPLPEDETILWQGSPKWQDLAKRALHARLVALYFGLLMAWNVVTALVDGAYGIAIGAVAIYAIPTAIVVGLIVLYARALARSAIYTITNKRVAIHFGLVIPRTINLPFSRLDGASYKLYKSGTADIPLKLQDDGATRLAFFHLWPHARPWKFLPTEPMLRGVPDGERVARILAEALVAFNAEAEATANAATATDATAAKGDPGAAFDSPDTTPRTTPKEPQPITD